MTIGVTDLLKRSAPFLLMAASLSACEKADIDRVQAALRGDDPPPTTTVYLAAAPALPVESSSSSSSVEPVQVAVVPPPEECHVTAWRGIFIDCHGVDVEGPER